MQNPPMRWLASAKNCGCGEAKDTPYEAAQQFLATVGRKRPKLISITRGEDHGDSFVFTWDAQRIHVEPTKIDTLPGAPK